ncbi:MAG: hypothetical protein Q4G08_06430 [Capnocytophaga sp.]|nr:hypothetical protein [Capnocytophaga sp.]
MKKILILVVALATFGWANAQSGELRVGANVGLPVGDASDLFSLNAGVNVSYLIPVVENLKVGGLAGYSTFFGKDVNGVKVDNIGYIPVAATAQYTLLENLFVGTDLGYAIGIHPSGLKGGFLYQPKVGYQSLDFEVYVGYFGINRENANLNAVTIGANFKL